MRNTNSMSFICDCCNKEFSSKERYPNTKDIDLCENCSCKIRISTSSNNGENK